MILADGKGEVMFLEPGEIYVGEAPARVKTLLGSCVSVCLWHPQGVGAICHYLLPNRDGGKMVGPEGRYAVDAFRVMQDGLRRHGRPLGETRAAMFGGGNMFGPTSSMAKHGVPLVGDRNIEVGRAWLAHIGVPVVAEYVGGYGHQNIEFDLGAGTIRVWLTGKEPFEVVLR